MTYRLHLLVPTMTKSRQVHLIICIFAFFLIAMPSATQAQTDSTKYLISTVDGNVYHGYIVEKQIEFIVLQTPNIGQITIQFGDIRLIERLEDGHNAVNYKHNSTLPKSTGKYRPDVYQVPVSYLLRPSGFGLKKGEGYYHNTWLFLNEMHLSFSDYFSVGLGMIPLPFEGGIPFWILPKVTIPIRKDKIHLGIGSLHGTLLETISSDFGMVYSDISIGSASSHISIGIGAGYMDSKWEDRPMYTFSGVLRVARTVSLVAENYAMSDFTLYSLICHQNLVSASIRYGLIAVSENFGFEAIPILGIVVPVNLKFK